MNTSLEILKYTLPSLIVFATAYLIIKSFLKKDDKRMQQERILANQDQLTPMRLQAYERMTLFLERISPESLLVRVSTPNITNQQLQQQLLANVRQEFEHNLSQRLYISKEAWLLAINAKESIVKLINTVGVKQNPMALSFGLSQAILIEYDKDDLKVLTKALDKLQQEVQSLF